MSNSPFQVAIIGGGPAGLMAADVLSTALLGTVRITVYDRMPSLGRKLLMAGRGGLNLTHSENLTQFMRRYGTHQEALTAALEALPPTSIRIWAEALGQSTFVGSSGRVFPRSMKASPLLRAWLNRLRSQGVQFRTRYLWEGWHGTGELRFLTPEGPVAIQADATILALGGASWPRLGSDGSWVKLLQQAGIGVSPLEATNCGFCVAWSDIFRDRFHGQPLKRIAITFCHHINRGELVLTSNGIEGGPIYSLSTKLRRAIATEGRAHITIDLRPDMAVSDLARLLDTPRRKQSLSSFLRKTAKLSPAAIGLAQEAAHEQPHALKDLAPTVLASLIKAIPVCLTATAPIERAISSVGGVRFDEIDSRFMLVQRPGVFVAGEMLDWEAPTGGYLLQACFATGAAAGRGVLTLLSQGRRANASESA